MEVESYYKLIYGIILFLVANTAAWFQLNFYRFYEVTNRNQLIFVILTAIPVTLGFFYAWKISYEALNDWWGCRMVAFATTFMVYPILTFSLLNEPFFTWKVFISLLLALGIVIVQFMWP